MSSERRLFAVYVQSFTFYFELCSAVATSISRPAKRNETDVELRGTDGSKWWNPVVQCHLVLWNNFKITLWNEGVERKEGRETKWVVRRWSDFIMRKNWERPKETSSLRTVCVCVWERTENLKDNVSADWNEWFSRAVESRAWLTAGGGGNMAVSLAAAGRWILEEAPHDAKIPE